MGHFIGKDDIQVFVDDDGVVYSGTDKSMKLADNEADFMAVADKEEKKNTTKERKKTDPKPLKTCNICGKKGFKGDVGLKRHKKTHGWKGKRDKVEE
jgi:hypothetical protein